MKHHERRTGGGFPYFKLATFDPISMCFRDGKQAFETAEDAYRAAKKPGKYRVSVVHEHGRTDLSEFEPCKGGRIFSPVSMLPGGTYRR
jgi:hypothetical protein